MNPINLVLSKLASAKRNGRSWIAQCPAHDDRRPSLSISEGDDGRALLCCHAGCAVEAIVEALGLAMADLMAGDNATATRPPRRKRTKATKVGGDTRSTFRWARDAVLALEAKHGKRSALWAYRDIQGKPISIVVRWDRPDDTKDIRPVSLHEDRWRIGGMPTPRPLYKLPDIRDTGISTTVYVVEGEKCVDVLTSLGLLATTSSGGARAAGKTDWTPLVGRSVTILPDYDEAGQHYAADVARLLHRLDPPATVRIVELPGLANGEDIADWLSRFSGDKATALRELQQLTDAARVVEPIPDSPEDQSFRPDPWQPFPTELYPETLRRFITETAAAIGCDESFVGLPVLTVVASAIGMTREVELKASWREPPIVWGAIIARSGTLKSPALDAATAPLLRLQADAMREHQAAMKEHAAAVLAAKSEKCVPPDPPVARRFVVSDCTVEALAPILEKNPRGLLLARDELSAWLCGFNQYKARGRGGDAPAWLELHRGGCLVVDRKAADKLTIFIPRAAVSVGGTIQPGVVASVLSGEHIENGLAARLLLIRPPELRKRWTERTPARETVHAYRDLIERLLRLEHADDGDGPEPLRLELSADARPVWKAWYNTHAERISEAPSDAEAAALAKIEGYAARFALIFALADDPHVVEVSGDAIRRGTVLADWFAYESRRVYAAMAESSENRQRRQLVAWIRKRGGSVTARDLLKNLSQYHSSDQAKAALDDLISVGLGCWVADSVGPQGGRQVLRFVLTDSTDTDETPGGAIKN
ncbi:MAG: DUF3987 domain-containing protein [Phycisphaerae bacterium]|nr:DUF3987 domain-containing protein [Phycisphaerae bacterium]